MAHNYKYHQIATEQEIKDFFNPNFWHEIKDYLFYFVKVFVIIGVFFIFLRSSVIDKVSVDGLSMFPYFNKGGIQQKDEIYIDKLSPKYSEYNRGQVIVLISPEGCRSEKTLYIKRVIGLPGEQIRINKGKVYIINSKYPYPGIELDEKEYLQESVKTYKAIINPDAQEFVSEKLLPNQYWFMGDNRSGSQDARFCGPIMKDQILGGQIYRTTPESEKGIFKLPKYNIGRL
jgi:signal peptidase I